MIGQFERVRSIQIAEWRDKVLSMQREFIDRITAQHGEALVAARRCGPATRERSITSCARSGIMAVSRHSDKARQMGEPKPHQ
jgi:hypothetical protein